MTGPNTVARLQTFWSTAALYLGGSAAIQAINLVAQPAFALFLSPAEWGTAAIYLFWMTAFGLVIGFQAQSALNNVRLEHGEAALPVYIRSVMPWYAVPTLVLLAVLGVAPDFWGRTLGLSAGYLALAVINGVLFAVTAMGMGHAITLGLRRRYVGLLIASTLVPLLVGFGLVAVLANNALARILGYFIGSVVVVLYQAVRSAGVRVRPERALVGFGIAITLPLLAHELIYLVLSQANRVFLSTLVNQEAAGVFAFAFSLANVAVIAATAVNSSWTPWYFEHSKQGEDDRIRRTGTQLLLGFGTAVGVVALISPEGLRLVTRAAYADGARVLPALVVCGHLLLIFNVMANYAIYRKRTRLVLAVSALAAVVSVVLNLTLIPHWTIMGAAVASLAASTSLAVAMTWVACHHLGSPNLPEKAAFTSLLLVGGCLALTWWGFDYPVLRFAVSALLVVALGAVVLRRAMTKAG
ncbi:lipopolysaccharide biosynthesis protein [Nocardioides sp. GCM10028917]|uniref:lipopolysaccharide biosynthesis protein n=1 Tax=Nocardioides sp. GCM10028917 TaxID=3273408 RepID=UPI00360D2E02